MIPVRFIGVGFRTAVAAAVGYVSGLLPTAQLVARLAARGVDVTESGTGNPGAANAAALLGKRAGAAVLVGDAGKAVLAGVVGGRLAGPTGVHVASTASLFGHCYPVTRPGQGGKGVAASIGQVLVSFPAYFPIDAAVAGVSYYTPGLRRDPRRATAVASMAWVACGLLWWRRRLPNLWGPPPSAGLAVAAAVSASVIAVRFEQTAIDTTAEGTS